MENELKTKFFLFLEELKHFKKMESEMEELLGLSALPSNCDGIEFEILAMGITKLIQFLDEESIDYKLEKTLGTESDNYYCGYYLRIKYEGDTYKFYDYDLK